MKHLSRDRICILCKNAYLASRLRARSSFCPECGTETLKTEESRVWGEVERAKRSGVAATLSTLEWLTILRSFDYRCAYCHGAYEIMEHITPIKLNGGTTAMNCVPACKSCNRRKDSNLLIDNIPLWKVQKVKEKLMSIQF